ncbi:MAG TPA: XdhC family protein [Thermoanaerobaculia bacterium]|jgi:xanthine dehydrogenase accessory factor|nr:XdhC family protein [Thermoanaerobaculia bacterium]
MRAELLATAADLARREEPFVLAVVVRRRPASSSQPGDMAVITAAGDFYGWLGGSCTQPTVVREARQALADGKARLVVLTPAPEVERRPGVTVFPMTCHSGGTVEIYLEPVLPAPRLVVFGVSPTARALTKLGKAMGYSVVAVDPAAEPDLFPSADQVLTDLARAPRLFAPSPGPRFAVVATLGEGDEMAIRDALALAPAYLGVVASRRRFAQLRETLLAGGLTAAALDAIRNPAGLDIGARSPEEIALSVLAEIVERRRAEAQRPGETEPIEREATMAIDPICGMTVETATARHTAEHAGRTYYFCCGGCRTRFLAEPERFAMTGSAA